MQQGKISYQELLDFDYIAFEKEDHILMYFYPDGSEALKQFLDYLYNSQSAFIGKVIASGMIIVCFAKVFLPNLSKHINRIEWPNISAERLG